MNGDLRRSSTINRDSNIRQRMPETSVMEQQMLWVTSKDEVLSEKLMEQICTRENLNRAYRRVRKNKGSEGVDGKTVYELGTWLKTHKDEVIEQLLTCIYKPQMVRGVEIPKPNGGKRQLGIPTVVDRLVQQAIVQILEPILDPTFSESSYGFRPNRNAHQALKKAQEYVRGGRAMVVDIDLEKFFDKVNHDVLMSRLAKRIKDKRLLKIVRRFLEAGIMKNGVVLERNEGMPQGGNLSPLLSNLLLDELDKELERRGHSFCRYADDCNIYVKSRKAGERVMTSLKLFLSKKLRLKVNETKSKVAPPVECKFLGYNITNEGKLIIAKESANRLKDKVRQQTRRNQGRSFETVVCDLNRQLKGWIGYFKLTEWPSQLSGLDGWIRRKLRCYKLKQKKRSFTIAKYLIELGVKAHSAWSTAKSNKGWWRLSKSPALHQALNNAWFDQLGLINLQSQSIRLNV